jgi:hypothetical protein
MACAGWSTVGLDVEDYNDSRALKISGQLPIDFAVCRVHVR